jgi:hypothetical protein
VKRQILSLVVLTLAACAPRDRTPAEPLVLTPVEAPSGQGAALPNLFTTADGRVVMTWTEAVGAEGHAIRISLRSGDGVWSEPRDVVRRNDLFVNWADFPSVVALSDGRLIAHWLQKSGGASYQYDVRLAESRDDGATWSASVLPHRAGIPAEHGFVSILPDAEGSASIFFLDGSAGLTGAPPADAGHDEHSPAPMHLSVNHWRNGMADSSKVVLDRRICDCCQTSAAMTARGPIVVFRDRSDAEVRDISIIREVEGDWTESRPVHEDNWTINACPVNGPAVIATGEQAAVAWFTGARDTAKVQIAFSTDAGSTFGTPTRVDEGRPAGRVGLQWVGNDALVSWLERGEGDTAYVKVRRVRRDGSMDDPITVSTSKGARSSGFPRITRLGDGVMLAWTLPGTPSIVRMATLLPAGQ